MSTKHTPGPWEIHHGYTDSKPFFVKQEETGDSWTAFQQVIGKGDMIIAEVTAYFGESNPEKMGYGRQKSQEAAIADARLIVAAPDLLEALQSLLNMEVKGHTLLDRLQFSTAGRDIAYTVNAAIAKATGGQP